MTDIPASPWSSQPLASEAMRAAEAAAGRRPASVPSLGQREPPGTVPMRFTGRASPFFGLLLRGLLLMVVTLGIYRFWLTAEIRRFYWGATAAGGEALSYTGTGWEKFRGFLIAIAVVLPLKAVAFLIALGLPRAEILVSLGLAVIFLFLSLYAIYAGRRYRLARTSWRGLRFRMVGSPWAYAVKAFGWWLLAIATLGLGYPWAAAAVERIKTRETFFGSAQADFTGDPLTLFKRGIVPWLIGVGAPFLLIATAFASLPAGLLERLLDGAFEAQPLRVGDAQAIGTALSMLSPIPLLALVVYPAFLAITFRWRAEGMRLGGASIVSTFTIGQAYGVAALAVAILFGLSIAIGLGALILGSIAAGALWLALPSQAAAVGMGLVMILAYIMVFGLYWVCKQVFFDLKLWTAQANSIVFHGLESLDDVVANNQDASAFGDSLGDAVDVTGAF